MILCSELRNHAVSPMPAPHLATKRTESFNLRLVLEGRSGARTHQSYSARAFDDTKKASERLNDMSQLRICEERCLFRRQNVRNEDAVRQLEQFARPGPSLWRHRISSLALSAGSRCCHENVTQIAENGGKNAANNNKGRRKQVAGICPNLLNPFD